MGTCSRLFSPAIFRVAICTQPIGLMGTPELVAFETVLPLTAPKKNRNVAAPTTLAIRNTEPKMKINALLNISLALTALVVMVLHIHAY